MDLCRPVIDIKVLVAHCNVNNLNYTKTLKLKVDFKVENKIYIQIKRKLAHSKEKKNKFLTKKSQSILSLLAKGRNCFIDFMVDSYWKFCRQNMWLHDWLAS